MQADNVVGKLPTIVVHVCVCTCFRKSLAGSLPPQRDMEKPPTTFKTAQMACKRNVCFDVWSHSRSDVPWRHRMGRKFDGGFASNILFHRNERFSNHTENMHMHVHKQQKSLMRLK